MSQSKTSYFFRFGAHHVARAGTPENWQRFFRAVESQGHFSRQAEHFGSFEQTSEDLETHCLPAVVELQDWDRFVHYGLIAANLRGLAEALAKENVLEPLTLHGRLGLAESLVDRLPDPATRARARAVIAGALGCGRPELDRVRDQLLQDLGSARAPTDPDTAEVWCRTLENVARLGRELRQCWTPWIDRLAAWPDLAVRAWKAVAEGLIEGGDLETPELWQAVGAINDHGYLLVDLPRRLADADPDDRQRLFEQIRHLEPHGEQIAWSTRAAVSGRLVAGEATAQWRRAVDDWGSIPWSLELVEAGRELWGKLAPELFEQLTDGIDGTVSAALRITRLEHLPDGVDGSAALRAIDQIPFPPQRLHWSLRYLATRPRGAAEPKGQLVAVGEYLARRRYVAPADDLCRFLNLVTSIFPRRLRLEVQNVLWAPESRSEVLRTLAREARSAGLLEELFERVERYASTVAANEAEAFELRLEILVMLTRRLCAMGRSLVALEDAVERLLPEERDTLRAAVAEEMGAIGDTDLARKASHPIRPGHLRRRTRLATATEAELGKLLAPGALYAAVADVSVVEDERLALAALLEAPVDAADLARRRFEGIRGKGREIQALVDLAWHTLAFQERHLDRRRQDRLAALMPLKQALGVVESDTWLVALTPELAALGSRLGTTQALAELKEATEKIVRHSSVPWSRREAALEALLVRLGCFFSGRDGELSAAQYRAAASFVDWLTDLPLTLADAPEAAELRRHWHRLVPRIVAARQRLPSRVAGRLRPSWQARLGLVPRKANTDSAMMSRKFERFRGAWGDLQPAQEGILRLCFASLEEQLRGADEITNADEPDPNVLQALIYLLATEAPERVPALVKRLPAGAERDRLILRWIRNGWAPAQDDQLFELLSSERVHSGKIWHGLHGDLIGEDAWVAELCETISRAELDSSDPRTTELRRRLWRLDRRHLPELARAVIGALIAGGRGGCERGLRLFLNALIGPRLGEVSSGEAGSDRPQGGFENLTSAATSRALSLTSGETEGTHDNRHDGSGRHAVSKLARISTEAK